MLASQEVEARAAPAEPSWARKVRRVRQETEAGPWGMAATYETKKCEEMRSVIIARRESGTKQSRMPAGDFLLRLAGSPLASLIV